MTTISPVQLSLTSLGEEAALICPETRRPLFEINDEAVCFDENGNISRTWRRKNGVLDLVTGERFDDSTDEACRCYEVASNTHSANFYWIPLFRKLFPDRRGRPPRLLAMGCGVGTEVEILCDAGFACWGVDNGNRSVDWSARNCRESLIMANGMSLPFADETFDAVFCGCVFPHVGVVGDSNQTAPSCEADRQRLAAEMVRVTRKGGHVIACCPNRLFPFDIFHGRAPGSYLPRFNPPWSKFLLSVSDFRKLFLRGGAESLEALPVEGFWGFVTMKRSLKGRLFSWPIRQLFHAASVPALAGLRSTALIPWIAVHCRK